jgi:deoxyuridine 5'-triphosphate nucleotidohydrolase
MHYAFNGRVERGSAQSAGHDVFAIEEVMIDPQGFKVIDVGLTWEADPGLVAIIKDRSSMAARGLRVGGGVIDADYRGPIKVVLMNHTFEPYLVEVGARIAQIIVIPCINTLICETERGEKGFGQASLKGKDN